VTAVAPTAPARPALGSVGRLVPIIGQLARRSLVLLTRQPSVLIPSVVFPIFLVVAFSGSFNGLDRVAFSNAMSWYAPLAVLQGSAFGGVAVGMATTREIESGFYDRLLLAPASRLALLLGPAIAAVARSLLIVAVISAIALIGGAEMPGGPVALLTLVGAAAGTCLMHAFWTQGLAFRFKSQRAAPIMQVGVFTTTFLATAQVPLGLMTGWLHAVARVNPMTNVFRLARAGWIDDVAWANCYGGLLALSVLVGLAFTFARRSQRRMIP
jgi:ABC-2 type transport system permease protein